MNIIWKPIKEYPNIIAPVLCALSEESKKKVFDYAESLLFSSSPDYTGILYPIETTSSESDKPLPHVSVIQVNKAIEPDTLSFREWLKWHGYSNSAYKRKSYNEKMDLHQRYNEYVECEREGLF